MVQLKGNLAHASRAVFLSCTLHIHARICMQACACTHAPKRITVTGNDAGYFPNFMVCSFLAYALIMTSMQQCQ